MSKQYTIPYSNTGLGGFVTFNEIRYHTPSWTVVEEDTTFTDLVVEGRPFEELFKAEDKQWKFTSARSGEEYTVRYNVNKQLSCSCWGYISHKKCKHIKEVVDNGEK